MFVKLVSHITLSLIRPLIFPLGTTFHFYKPFKQLLQCQWLHLAGLAKVRTAQLTCLLLLWVVVVKLSFLTLHYNFVLPLISALPDSIPTPPTTAHLFIFTYSLTLSFFSYSQLLTSVKSFKPLTYLQLLLLVCSIGERSLSEKWRSTWSAAALLRDSRQ